MNARGPGPGNANLLIGIFNPPIGKIFADVFWGTGAARHLDCPDLRATPSDPVGDRFIGVYPWFPDEPRMHTDLHGCACRCSVAGKTVRGGAWRCEEGPASPQWRQRRTKNHEERRMNAKGPGLGTPISGLAQKNLWLIPLRCPKMTGRCGDAEARQYEGLRRTVMEREGSSKGRAWRGPFLYMGRGRFSVFRGLSGGISVHKGVDMPGITCGQKQMAPGLLCLTPHIVLKAANRAKQVYMV